MLDVVQFQGHHQVRVDRSRDALITDFGRATLDDRYLLPGESYQDLFARVSSFYGDDAGHAQRLYDYMSRMWFMPATPVLSNGGTTRGLPISCFLNEASDSLEGIVGLWNENVWLASKGGGIGSYWGNLRSIGEKVGQTVGFRTRLESAVSAATRIEVVTTGLMVRRLLGDPGLDGVSTVILDEIHERSLEADLALALCLDAQAMLRPDLRLLAMSATLDGARLSALMNAPIVESAGRMHPPAG